MRVTEKRITMSTKRTITTTEKGTENTMNTFTLNEKTGILTLKLPVQFNKNGTVLQACHLSKDEGKEWQYMLFEDSKGNKITLYKTGFNFEPKVKLSKKLGIDTSKLKTLSTEEQDLLKSILSKLA